MASDEGVASVMVDVERLQPGIFVSLAEHWLDHPFMFNEFRISNQRQIDTLREMGLTQVRCVPSRSTAQLLPVRKASTPPPAPPAPPSADELAAIEAKRQRIARVKATREDLARCEKAYARTAGAVRDLMQRLHASPQHAAELARDVVGETVETLLTSQDSVLHLIGQKRGDDNTNFHALNVMILSLMLGRAYGLDEEKLVALGTGALFHDMGKVRLPDAILRKGSQRNKAEEDFYRLHTVYGAQLAGDVSIFAPSTLDVIRHHHEHMDGSGFPDGIPAAKTSVLARIVAVANRYDNLCNAAEYGDLTPAEVLSQMYGKESNWWDTTLLQRFIKNLGVFPPGSIVQLSNGVFGLVVAVNRSALLKPSVLIHDAAVPRSEANIVDLIDADDVRIERAIRRDTLSEEVLAYLAPRHQVIYFYDRPDHKA